MSRLKMCIRDSIEEPRVILRRHVVITSGPKQPYHAAATMALPDAEAFMKRCTTSTAALATEAVGDVVAELSSLGFRVGGSCVLLSEGKPAGDLARILSAHPLIHTAEGEMCIRDRFERASMCFCLPADKLISSIAPEFNKLG